MINTTLCYIVKDDKVLMLYRNSKKNDPNGGKWVGIGGKFEEGETKDQCLIREVYEETGLRLTEFTFLGVIHFKSDIYEDEDMYLYIGDAFEGQINPFCDEGELKWINIADVLALPLWAGDKYFLEPLLNGEKNINMTLSYEGDELVSCVRDKND